MHAGETSFQWQFTFVLSLLKSLLYLRHIVYNDGWFFPKLNLLLLLVLSTHIDTQFFLASIYKETYISVVFELFSFLELQNIMAGGERELKHNGPQRMGVTQSSCISFPSIALSQGVTCYIMSYHVPPKRPCPKRVFWNKNKQKEFMWLTWKGTILNIVILFWDQRLLEHSQLGYQCPACTIPRNKYKFPRNRLYQRRHPPGFQSSERRLGTPLTKTKPSCLFLWVTCQLPGAWASRR